MACVHMKYVFFWSVLIVRGSVCVCVCVFVCLYVAPVTCAYTAYFLPGVADGVRLLSV